MDNLYTRIQLLCAEKNIRPGHLCNALGLSRSLMTDLKMGRKQGLSADTLNKIAKFFSVSVDYLLGNVSDPFFVLGNDAILADINSYEETEKAPAESGKRLVSDEEVKFALFRGREDITDAMYQEVLSFAEYVARREEEKKKKE